MTVCLRENSLGWGLTPLLLQIPFKCHFLMKTHSCHSISNPMSSSHQQYPSSCFAQTLLYFPQNHLCSCNAKILNMSSNRLCELITLVAHLLVRLHTHLYLTPFNSWSSPDSLSCEGSDIWLFFFPHGTAFLSSLPLQWASPGLISQVSFQYLFFCEDFEQ